MNNIKQVWQTLAPDAVTIELKKKQILLNEGDVADTIYYVKDGCLRSWINHDGKDISFQFFFEGSLIASFESFMFDVPSTYTIESLLPSKVQMISKSLLMQRMNDMPQLKEVGFDVVCERLRHYQHLFLSRIKDSPQQRYEDLLKSHPELVRRIPQHYIASYLGITSVSLSRIRCR